MKKFIVNRISTILIVFITLLSIFEMVMLIFNLFNYISCYQMDKINYYTLPLLLMLGIILVIIELRYNQ